MAKALHCDPAYISRVRRGKEAVSALFLLRAHLLTKTPVEELLLLLGIESMFEK